MKITIDVNHNINSNSLLSIYRCQMMKSLIAYTALFKEFHGLNRPDSGHVSLFSCQRVHGMVFKYV